MQRWPGGLQESEHSTQDVAPRADNDGLGDEVVDRDLGFCHLLKRFFAVQPDRQLVSSKDACKVKLCGVLVRDWIIAPQSPCGSP